jgi:hypothetical protein
MEHGWTGTKLEWARMKHLWTRMEHEWTRIEHEWTRMEHEWIQILHEWNTNEVRVSTNTTLTNTNGTRVCNQRLKTSWRLHHLYVQLDRRFFLVLIKMEASTNTIGLQSRLTHALVFFSVLGYSRMSSERFNSGIRLPYGVSARKQVTFPDEMYWRTNAATPLRHYSFS